MKAAECDEVYVTLPDGTMERDDKGIVPPGCDVDEIPDHLRPLDGGEIAYFYDRILNFDDTEFYEFQSLFGDGEGPPDRPGTPLHRYIRMRLDDQSHNMAYMLATRSFPGVKSDAIFNQGRCNGNQFESCPARGDWLRREAVAAGVSTTGKYYASGLASFPGDPSAWVSDRHDVVSVAKAKGLTVEGYVTHREPQRGPGPSSSDSYEVAPDLLAGEARQIVAANPGSNYEAVYDRVKSIRSGNAPPSPKDLAP